MQQHEHRFGQAENEDVTESQGISRRQLLSRSVTAGAVGAVCVTLPGPSSAAGPTRGGMLTAGVGHGATTDTLEPGHFDNGFMTQLTYGFNGYMTEVGADGSLKPSIAETWEGSTDAKTWTFKLRDAEFHDGKSVTANDVVASINYHRDEATTSTAAPLVSTIVDIKADDDRTVVVDLESGNADFPFILTDYHMPILPVANDSVDWQSGIGCGTYRLDRFSPGESAWLSRHANHWNTNVGYVDNVQIMSLVDPNARTTAFVSGEVDIIDRVDLKTAALLGKKPGVSVHSITGTQHYTFPMRTDMAPFDDVNVRRAVKHAVNRQELVDKILFGYGEVGNDVPIGSGQRFFNTEMPQTPYDPDKAKYFLRKAEMNNLKVDLSASDAAFTGAVDAAVLIQNSAEPAGIGINVVREPSDGYWSDVWMNKGWSASYWSGRPVEDMMFSTAYASGVAWNDTFWSNARFDDLLVAARAELNEGKRREMYYEMQVILNDEGGALIPFFASYVFATSERVGFPGQFASNGELDGYRWMERWWRA